MRMKLIINKTFTFLLVTLLLVGLTGCQNKKNDIQGTTNAEEAIIEETKNDVEGMSVESDANENKDITSFKDEDLSGTYWRAEYYETFPWGDLEGDITEYDEDYYRFMDVTFYDDKTAEFRSIVGNNYESVSGKAQWRITEMGDVILENITPFEGMCYGYGFIPRFSLVDGEYAPKHEDGLISLEYMDGCVYFKKMEKTDPFDGVDLTNSDRLKQALEQAKVNDQDITGEWVLLSTETDGNKWYALESGVECVLYVGDMYADYHRTDSLGNIESYYGMRMTYDDMALYTDLECDYSIYFHPDPSEYEGRYEYLNFGMAPDGEFLIVQMTVGEIGQENPTQSYLTFQRGFG